MKSPVKFLVPGGLAAVARRGLVLVLAASLLNNAAAMNEGAIIVRDSAALQKEITDAYQAGRKKFVIPAGTYRLQDSAKGAYLTFADLKDFEIDATGVSFLRTDPLRGGVEFRHCQRVTLRGLTLLNETPPFTQGVLEALDPQGEWYDVRIDRGYPQWLDQPHPDLKQLRATVIIPGTRQYKEGSMDCFFSHAERTGPDTFRLFFRKESKLDPKTHPAAVGDWLNFRGVVIRDILLAGCERMVIDQVTVKGGGGFCVMEEGGEGGNRFTYKITYGNRPAGADKDPLLASNADGFHSRGMRQGPILENCFFEGMHDDGIPIHGSFAMVAEGSGNKVIMTGGYFLRAGDPLRFYDPHGSFAAEGRVTSITPMPDYKLTQQVAGFRRGRTLRFVEVTLDRPVEVGFQYVVSDSAANGAGYIIRNCTIRNHRARGLLLKSDDGLVENNVIEGSTIAGIVIAPEIWWHEAGYSRNVVIRNNVIRRAGYSTAGSSDHQAGAITICGAAGEPDKIVPVYQDEAVARVKPDHANIIIENNTIEDCNGVNLLLGMARNVTVRGNKFNHAQKQQTARGVASGVDPASLVWIYNCEDVTFEGNEITDRGAFGREVVTANANSQRINGTGPGFADRR